MHDDRSNNEFIENLANSSSNILLPNEETEEIDKIIRMCWTDERRKLLAIQGKNFLVHKVIKGENQLIKFEKVCNSLANYAAFSGVKITPTSCQREWHRMIKDVKDSMLMDNIHDSDFPEDTNHYKYILKEVIESSAKRLSDITASQEKKRRKKNMEQYQEIDFSVIASDNAFISSSSKSASHRSTNINEEVVDLKTIDDYAKSINSITENDNLLRLESEKLRRDRDMLEIKYREDSQKTISQLVSINQGLHDEINKKDKTIKRLLKKMREFGVYESDSE